MTLPRSPITIGIIVTFMFHRFINSLTVLKYIYLFSHSFNFPLWSVGTANYYYYYYYYYYFTCLPPRFVVVFHWSMRESMSFQVKWIFLIILRDLNNALYGFDYSLHLQFLQSFSKTWGLVPSEQPITVIAIVLMIPSIQYPIFLKTCPFCLFSLWSVFNTEINLMTWFFP